MKFSRVSDFLARDEASANFDANNHGCDKTELRLYLVLGAEVHP